MAPAASSSCTMSTAPASTARCSAVCNSTAQHRTAYHSSLTAHTCQGRRRTYHAAATTKARVLWGSDSCAVQNTQQLMLQIHQQQGGPRFHQISASHSPEAEPTRRRHIPDLHPDRTHLIYRHDWVISHHPLPRAVLAHVEVLHVQLRLALQQLLHQRAVACLSCPVQGCVGSHVWQYGKLRVDAEQQLQ